jgi:hypothetical protein
VITIPIAAVTTRHGVDTVRIATEADEIDVPVILGETFTEAEGARVEILTGIHEGDRIVLP